MIHKLSVTALAKFQSVESCHLTARNRLLTSDLQNFGANISGPGRGFRSPFVSLSALEAQFFPSYLGFIKNLKKKLFLKAWADP